MDVREGSVLSFLKINETSKFLVTFIFVALLAPMTPQNKDR